jgi:hypothetical protein
MHLINNRYNLFDGPGHAHRPRFLTDQARLPLRLRHHSKALLSTWTDP